ncbi:MAG: hypothetical protein SAK29_00575 [Scytonema sp. PMC 1069.18]|nr:hypothetical protein [Scytonema sp. PMC 1069.18]MEC4885576.1 hypothetical protein [Scytonema sp. PMC 1070.18]
MIVERLNSRYLPFEENSINNPVAFFNQIKSLYPVFMPIAYCLLPIALLN